MLSLLALSRLIHGNESEGGESARREACGYHYPYRWRYLVTERQFVSLDGLQRAAQATFESSINSNWIDPTLAQAAWVSLLTGTDYTNADKSH